MLSRHRVERQRCPGRRAAGDLAELDVHGGRLTGAGRGHRPMHRRVRPATGIEVRPPPHSFPQDWTARHRWLMWSTTLARRAATKRTARRRRGHGWRRHSCLSRPPSRASSSQGPRATCFVSGQRRPSASCRSGPGHGSERPLHCRAPTVRGAEILLVRLPSNAWRALTGRWQGRRRFSI